MEKNGVPKNCLICGSKMFFEDDTGGYCLRGNKEFQANQSEDCGGFGIWKKWGTKKASEGKFLITYVVMDWWEKEMTLDEFERRLKLRSFE